MINMKNKIFSYICCFTILLGIAGCSDLLEVKPLTMTSAEDLLKSPSGLKTLMATLYNNIPMEDFTFTPADGGFNKHGWGGGLQSTFRLSMYTDESTASAGTGVGPVSFSYWPYTAIRQTNMFFESLESVKGSLNETTYEQLKSEGHFVRAYIYFGLAKRYGGVPIIDYVQDGDYIPGSSNTELFIPRNTEKETWKFILDELDLAIAHLPLRTNSADGVYRATKWTALALKSRVALHAASVAKYWNNAPLSGTAVDQNLAKMTAADANEFYQACIDASDTLLAKGGFSLYKPAPANKAEAATNFQNLFLTTTTSANPEIIYVKAYLDGTTVTGQGHCWDITYSPSQASPGFHKFGRFSPTLDMVDIFEDYTDNGVGASAKITTRTDGVENYSYANPSLVNLSLPFKEYDDPFEAFANKDARLLASVIVPGSTYKGIKMVLQGGMVKSTGTIVAYQDGSEVKSGVTYYSYGAVGSTGFSGFYKIGSSDDANFSCSGFLIKKYLQEGKTVKGVENSSFQSFIDMRLAEIYLNYAEAVVESGLGDATRAETYINALRHRAAHTDNIPLTLANVLKERRVELAFEGFRYWDLMRRREFHSLFNATRRTVLVPMVDLRGATPKYIFVRANNYYDEYANGRTFNQATGYYEAIPGRTTNNLVENPGY
jgi:starch-binding outer membrane protein, SusD/RagB family